MEEEEKVSLLMILKRAVGESHHISIVKEPHLRKIHRSRSGSTKVISLNRSIEFNDLAYSAVSKKTVGKKHKSRCTNPEMYRG